MVCCGLLWGVVNYVRAWTSRWMGGGGGVLELPYGKPSFTKETYLKTIISKEGVSIGDIESSCIGMVTVDIHFFHPAPVCLALLEALQGLMDLFHRDDSGHRESKFEWGTLGTSN